MDKYVENIDVFKLIVVAELGVVIGLLLRAISVLESIV